MPAEAEQESTGMTASVAEKPASRKRTVGISDSRIVAENTRPHAKLSSECRCSFCGFARRAANRSLSCIGPRRSRNVPLCSSPA